MKKAIKTLVILILFFVVFPSLAGVAIMALWNNIMPAVCGFAVITFWQGIELFLLGQILTGGILLALFLVGGGIHALHHHHGTWRSHWHDMTGEQRREFIERRRREHLRFADRLNKREDAAE